MTKRIELDDLVSGEKVGSAFFEEVMRSINAQIHGEFAAKRITGSDYAQVYMSSMQGALQTAMGYLLQYESVNQDLILKAEQIKGQELSNRLIEAQIRNLDADTVIKGKQLDVMDKQIEQASKNIELTDKNIAKVTKDIEVQDKQMLVMDSQIAQTTEQTKLITQNKTNAEAQFTVITKQATKLDNEIALLAQKTKTEISQIEDQVDGKTVTGSIGKTKELQTAQKESFTRDAEQKASKIMIDTWIALLSTTGEADPAAAGLANSEVNKVLQVMKNGIGV